MTDLDYILKENKNAKYIDCDIEELKKDDYCSGLYVIEDLDINDMTLKYYVIEKNFYKIEIIKTYINSKIKLSKNYINKLDLITKENNINDNIGLNFVKYDDIVNYKSFLNLCYNQDIKYNINTTIINDKLTSNKLYSDVIIITNNISIYDKYFEGIKYICIDDISLEMDKINQVLQKFYYNRDNEINNNALILFDCDMRKLLCYDDIKYILEYGNNISIEYIISDKNFVYDNKIFNDIIFIDYENNEKIIYDTYNFGIDNFELYCKIKNNSKDKILSISNDLKYYYYHNATILDSINIKETLLNPKYLIIGDDKKHIELINDIISLTNKNIFYITNNSKINNIYSNLNIIKKFNSECVKKIICEENKNSLLIIDNCFSLNDINFDLCDKFDIGYLIISNNSYYPINKWIENNIIKHLIILDNNNISNDLHTLPIEKNIIKDNNLKKNIFDTVIDKYIKNKISCLIYSNNELFTYYL